MFLDFFLLLKNSGIPVTLREYLTLLQGLKQDLIEKNVQQFYYLSRASLIKHEEDLDTFDQLFGVYFQGVEQITDEEILSIPEDWLRKNGERHFTQEEMEQVKSMGGMEELLERIQELYKEQQERHQGGNKWIGTGGTSPFGAYGYNPEGIRIGQHESRHKRAVKVWDQRNFENLRTDIALETRNMKMVLKKLRRLTREGMQEELDLDDTIRKTSKNAGLLDLQMVKQKKNNIKILVLFDVGGSMDDYINLCSQLFSAMRYEFDNLEFFYFHNCVYERLWQDNERRWNETTETMELVHRFNSDYQLIFVGDASMSPYEIFSQYGSVEQYNPEAGITWLKRLKEHFNSWVWLNPVPENEWKFTQSIGMLREIMDNKMYPLTTDGLEKGIEELKK